MCPWQTHVLRNVSHWAEIGFWCSINHKQCKTKDIYSVGEGKRNWADIMSHSVWIRLKTAIAEWTRQWVKLCFLDWQLQTERQKQRHCTCFWTTLKPLGLFVRLLFWRTGETDEKAEKSKHEWLQIMRNFDQAPYHLWHLRKREKRKIRQFDNPAIRTLHALHSWLTKAHHMILQRQVLFSFPVVIRAQSSPATHPAALWRMKTDASMD